MAWVSWFMFEHTHRTIWVPHWYKFLSVSSTTHHHIVRVLNTISKDISQRHCQITDSFRFTHTQRDTHTQTHRKETRSYELFSACVKPSLPNRKGTGDEFPNSAGKWTCPRNQPSWKNISQAFCSASSAEGMFRMRITASPSHSLVSDSVQFVYK